jgi:hypothetical protein
VVEGLKARYRLIENGQRQRNSNYDNAHVVKSSNDLLLRRKMDNLRRDPARLLEAYYDPLVKEADPCLFCGGTLLAVAAWKPAAIIPRPTWRIFSASLAEHWALLATRRDWP